MIQLYEDNQMWSFVCHDCALQMIQIDFRLSLRVADANNWVRTDISNACMLRTRDEEFLLKPETTESLAPILSFFNAAVNSVALTKAGKLTITFADGAKLKVEPGGPFEAWEVGCLINGAGHLFVSAPGGEVSHFQRPERTTKAT